MTGEILQIAGLVLFIAIAGIVARRLVWQKMRAIGSGGLRALEPAEFAYLNRDGDMPHTLVVMSVDLVQRQLKAGDTDMSNSLRPYEKQVWLSVKDFVRNLAEQKAGHLIPMDDFKNPMKWAVRFGAIRKFVGETLRSLVKDLIEDPRHIKKYFSFAGIGRLAVYCYTSSVRNTVEREMRQLLLTEGFLVPESRRKNFGRGVLMIAPLMVAAAVAAAYFTGTLSIQKLLVTMSLGFVNAVVLRLLMELPGFIPTYEEFAKVSVELKRGGARLALVRAILKGGKVILVCLMSLATILLLAIESALIGLLYQANLIPLLVAQTIFGFSMLACILDWHALTVREHASLAAEEELTRTRKAIAAITPLDTFRHTLADPNYDPTLSQLVALYGIETLWLLS